jgi:hypothetical protein
MPTPSTAAAGCVRHRGNCKRRWPIAMNRCG